MKLPFLSLALAAGLVFLRSAPLDLGSRLELFVDDYLVERLDGTQLKLHEPAPAGIALRFDRPWEGAFSGYVTVMRDHDRFRMFYRGSPIAGKDGSTNEVTCYAESTDGLFWRKPDLHLFSWDGRTDNNIILAGQAPFSHNFAPFLDTRPDAPPSERYKAFAGTSETGLFGFVSSNAIVWRKISPTPLVRKGAFDSQNVAFWSESEHQYLLYLRSWTGGEFRGFRTISRAFSTDFLSWSEPLEMGFGDAPREHLYTSQTHSYFRAPHLYVATPMRFLPGRKVLTPEQSRELGVDPGYASDCAEAVLMTSRGGTNYTRRFMEGFIRPGPDLGNWASRAGLSALGIVPTGATEMSLFKQNHYAQPTSHLVRYTLRTDGFVSINAPYRGGEFWSKPLVCSGDELVINFATGAAGSMRLELIDEAGKAIPGFSLDDATELIGDDIERVVSWRTGPSLASLRDRPIQLHFVMKDADLYSLRFRSTGHTVISRGPEAGTYQAFPDICRLNNGELLCVFYAGYTHISLPRDHWPKGGRVCYVRSLDDGRHWSTPKTLVDTPLDDRDPHIAQMQDGTLVCSFFTYEPRPGTNTLCNTLVVSSTDQGETWSSEPQLVIAGWPSSAPVRELPNGTRLLGVYREDATTAFGGVVRSTDHGRTWSAPIPIGQGSGVRLDAETDVVLRKDGSLLAALRGDRVPMHFAISRDEGLTWSPVQSFGFPGHCPHFTRLSSGTLLLTHRLPSTALHLSRDDGVTWEGPISIDNTIGAYPSTVELRDRTVLIVYYEEGEGSGIRQRHFRVDRDGVRFMSPAPE